MKDYPVQNLLQRLTQRPLQLLARILPGAQTVRVMLHRARGVHIGEDVFISQDVILETEHPELITIGDRVFVGMRATVVAHMRELRQGVTIEHDAFIGPGVIILPNVTIGQGAVVTAGSVVTHSVAPMKVVQGNPAVPIATCGIPLGAKTTIKEFSRRLQPLVASRTDQRRPEANER